MKITDISQQVRTRDRVNISVDGVYRFSLDIFQVGELGIKIGKEYTDDELLALEAESQFGKLYGRALEYCMMRPHSAREVRDYLWRKTLPKKVLKKPQSPSRRASNSHAEIQSTRSEIIEKPGVSRDIADRVFDRLVEKGYINDEKFARFWVAHRNQTKGTSIRKLQAELQAKGVEREIVALALGETDRTDAQEIAKIIAKKRAKYDDKKLLQYLARQGFSYDDITHAMSGTE
ncbi:RecX family transcriptional regulator [Candidatus Saccharibacteria bacterium]|nr:RecX family transcriptional regulator [Candidatus Saccharibacteria bacterium]